MRIGTLAKISVAAVLIVAVFAFGRKNKNTSSVTGWKYNDPATTDFVVKKGLKTQVPPGMVAIVGGSFTLGEKTEFITQPRNNRQRRITVSSFYMDQYEIRNIDWREYSNWMRVVFGNSKPELIKRAQPDVNTWREQLAYNEPYLQNYFTHPSFNNYPIVGVDRKSVV